MTKQTPIQIDDETRRRITQIAEWYGLPKTRNTTSVVVRAVDTLFMIEHAKRSMSDSDFLGFVAEMFSPVE